MTTTTDKRVRVILAFHAHEPLWDTPRRLQRAVLDRRIAAGVLGESYIRKRVKEGRNVYRDLVALSERLGAPITLDITNELAHQVERHLPSTFAELKRAYAARTLHPIYVPAHHTHAALLEPEELIDELRLNEECIHGRLEAPLPERRGIFFTECSIDRRFLPAVEAYGIDYTFCPALDPERVDFTISDADYDHGHRPFRLGTRLVAFERNFPVSQEVWRPLTLRFPQKVKYQGFLVGEEPIFAEEYRRGAPCAPTVDREAGVELYASVLRRAIGEAPDQGVILYLQDLELMDFGEAALELLGDAWEKVRAEGLAHIEFTSPDRLLVEDDVTPPWLPEVKFERVSWAPEIRPALRSDGHYPPRYAGPFRGLDADLQIFRKEPFIFWESGRFITTTLGWLIGAFGFSRTPRLAARVLFDEDYRLERLPPRVRLPMLLRLSKRACNFGWYPEEGLNKRPYLDGYLICDALLIELELEGTRPDANLGAALPSWALPGLRRIPELIIDPRLAYLQFGLERLREERGADPQAAFLALAAAAAERRRADEEISRAEEALAELKGADHQSDAGWARLIGRLREHFGAVFLALDHLQRAWGHSDPEFLVGAMYRYLYDLYPPKAPEVLASIAAALGSKQEPSVYEEGV